MEKTKDFKDQMITKKVSALEQYKWLNWGYSAGIISLFIPFVYAGGSLLSIKYAFLFTLPILAFESVVIFIIQKQRLYISKRYK